MTDREVNAVEADRQKAGGGGGGGGAVVSPPEAAAAHGQQENTEVNGRHQQQQLRGAETVATTFTSPYYDPFGEELELQAEIGGEGTIAPIIQAYNSTGARRS